MGAPDRIEDTRRVLRYLECDERGVEDKGEDIGHYALGRVRCHAAGPQLELSD